MTALTSPPNFSFVLTASSIANSSRGLIINLLLETFINFLSSIFILASVSGTKDTTVQIFIFYP